MKMQNILLDVLSAEVCVSVVFFDDVQSLDWRVRRALIKQVTGQQSETFRSYVCLLVGVFYR